MDQPGKKLKRIYWLCEKVSDHHLAIAVTMQQEGWSVQFFGKADSLVAELSKQRVSTLVIGDEGSDTETEKAIQRIASLPEAQGIRMILSVSRPGTQVTTTAACHNFRDLIPISLGKEEWVERFIFASAKAGALIAEPIPQIAYTQVANLALPGRLVWVGDDRLLVEAKFHPPPGTTLTLSGKFMDAIGMKRVTITVAECRKTDLVYRFSDAIVAQWSVPGKSAVAATTLIQKMRQTDFGPRIKVFIVLQDADTRSQLIKQLEPLRFELNVALQKQSIIDEPKFFSPQIVFIEDKICQEGGGERFRMLCHALAPDVPIVVIGSKVALEDLQAIAPLRRIILQSKLPERLSEAIQTKFLPNAIRKRLSSDSGAVHIAGDHPFSMVELHFSARVTKMHPRSAQLALPFPIATFGLCRVETPEFKRAVGYAPFAKVTSVYKIERSDLPMPFPYVAETYLCDTLPEHKLAIAKQLAQFVVDRIYQVDEQSTLALKEKPAVEVAKHSSRNPNAPRKTESTNNASPLQLITDIARDKNIQLAAGFFAISASTIFVIYLLATVIAPNWKKSGGTLTDSLKKFSPKHSDDLNTDVVE